MSAPAPAPVPELAHLMRKGMILEGGSAEQYDEGHSVRVNAPHAQSTAALLVSRDRLPEYEDGLDRCTKCKGGDVVVQFEWPDTPGGGKAGDGFAIQFCRSCMEDRPFGRPLVVKFRE